MHFSRNVLSIVRGGNTVLLMYKINELLCMSVRSKCMYLLIMKVLDRSNLAYKYPCIYSFVESQKHK